MLKYYEKEIGKMVHSLKGVSFFQFKFSLNLIVHVYALLSKLSFPEG